MALFSLANDQSSESLSAQMLALAGGGFVVVGGFCIIVPVVTLTWDLIHSGFPASKEGDLLTLVQPYFPYLTLILTGLISALLGQSMVRASGRSNYSSLPQADYALLEAAIKDGKSDPVDQYIRIRALSGFSGNFTKIGLTGLPLTTVAITIFFTYMAVFTTNPDMAKAFLDLTKLTLGAFIGSFVQRQVERTRQDVAAGASAAPAAVRPVLPT